MQRGTLIALVVATSVPGRGAGADEVDPAKLASSAIDARVTQLEAKLAAQEARLDAQQAALDHRRKELDELELASAAGIDPAAAKEPTFRIYGFIDIGLQKVWADDQSKIESTAATFVLGNANLYFDFRPASDWSSLLEVRLTNYPSGAETVGISSLGVRYQRTDTSVFDPGNGIGDDSVRWGAIVLERAYIEWHQHEQLSVRVGEFLTPYGIWNVDHGTPTLISLYRPDFVADEMWPTHQLGVEVFGTLSDVLVRGWQLEYHAYVSNGRTPGVVDLTNDKMIGGRVVMSTTHPRPMALGISFISGSYLDRRHLWDPATGAVSYPVVIAYNETGVAADGSIDVGAFRLRTELTTRRLDYENGKREQTAVAGVSRADALEGDLYVLGAYRIPHTRFEPYLYAEGLRVPTTSGDLMVAASAGLNIYFTPAIQLKMQYAHVRWLDTTAPTLDSNHTQSFLAAKLVMGF